MTWRRGTVAKWEWETAESRQGMPGPGDYRGEQGAGRGGTWLVEVGGSLSPDFGLHRASAGSAEQVLTLERGEQGDTMCLGGVSKFGLGRPRGSDGRALGRRLTQSYLRFGRITLVQVSIDKGHESGREVG